MQDFRTDKNIDSDKSYWAVKQEVKNEILIGSEVQKGKNEVQETVVEVKVSKGENYFRLNVYVTFHDVKTVNVKTMAKAFIIENNKTLAVLFIYI